jgi:N-terminal acetyltransferase 2
VLTLVLLGIWTQLALAYAIHKTFIFVRVPLTAAITPKVVKTLRGWGWNIGKMPKRGSFKSGSSQTGVNTKGTGVKPDN